jgi:hypothetical protein
MRVDRSIHSADRWSIGINEHAAGVRCVGGSGAAHELPARTRDGGGGRRAQLRIRRQHAEHERLQAGRQRRCELGRERRRTAHRLIVETEAQAASRERMLAGQEAIRDEPDRVAIARVVGALGFGRQPLRRLRLQNGLAGDGVDERVGAELERVVAHDELIRRDRAGKQRLLLAHLRGLGERRDHRERALPRDGTGVRVEPHVEREAGTSSDRHVRRARRFDEAADAGAAELDEALRGALADGPQLVGHDQGHPARST